MKSKIKAAHVWRSSAVPFATAALLLATFAAQAQPFPSKPIRIVSAFGAGMGPDATMRVLGEKLSKQLGQQVIMDPRPGGNGFIAITNVKQAPADGYTLLLVSNAHLAINPNLLKNVPYSAETDFHPVSTIYRAPFFIATAANGPYRTLGHLLSAARTAPNRVTYSIPYVGSPAHLGGAFLEHLTGTKFLAVAYKDAHAITSVAAGETDFTIATLGSFNALIAGGKLSVLAIAQPTRSKAEPQIPTVEEAGGPKGLAIESWVGLVAPRGTPPEVVRRLSEEIGRALASPDLIERYRAGGVVASGTTPADMAALIRDDGRAYGDLIKRIGMTIE